MEFEYRKEYSEKILAGARPFVMKDERECSLWNRSGNQKDNTWTQPFILLKILDIGLQDALFSFSAKGANGSLFVDHEPFSKALFCKDLETLVLPIPSVDTKQKQMSSIEYAQLYQGEKYFNEATGLHVRSGYHYDKRFFNDTVSLAQKHDSLRAMFQVWGTFADTHYIPYWIAHGSLLGWHWGQKILPWDDDIDIQVTFDTLHAMDHALERHANGLIQLSETHVLDINPHYVMKGKSENNVIDARIIDTKTGLFIDITALTQDTISIPASKALHYEPSNDKVKEEQDKIIHCKSPHFYQKKHIFPLVRVTFENVPTWRPFDYETCLVMEYRPSCLKMERFNRHVWTPDETLAATPMFGRLGYWKKSDRLP
jgi:hypothetical protein